jgi:Flp pilus assembly protein TadG
MKADFARAPRGIGRFWQGQEGQSLIEVALFLPIFTALIVYAVDSLTSASRNAMEYAIQANSSPAQAAAPGSTAVSNLAIASVGLPGVSSSTVTVRVCSSSVGVTLPANTAQCATPSTGAGSVSGTADTDPESPTFQLNRVDIAYTIALPIPLPSTMFPNRTLHRMVEMREVQ